MNKRAVGRVRNKWAAAALAAALTVSGVAVGVSSAAAAPVGASAIAGAIVAPPAQAAKKVMVTTADLNLRKSPSTKAKILTTLKKGTKVTVIGSKSSWRKVTAGTRTGWVSGKFLAAPPAKTSVKIASIVPVEGSTVISGKQVRVSGSASKNLAGKKLTVKVKVGSGWQTLSAKPKVTSAGKFTFTAKAIGIGKTTYRVVFAVTKTGKRLAASSASRAVTVWKWLPLAGQRIVDSEAAWGGWQPHPSVVTMAGVTYRDGLLGWSRGGRVTWSEFNTSFQCRTFTALAGADDSSSGAAVGTSFVSVDGSDVASSLVDLKLGKPTRITVDLTDVMRLRLSVFGSSSAEVSAAWGDARILCKQDVNPRD